MSLLGTIFNRGYDIHKEHQKLRDSLADAAAVRVFSGDKGWKKIEEMLLKHVSNVDEELVSMCSDPIKNAKRQMLLWSFRECIKMLIDVVHAPDKTIGPLEEAFIKVDKTLKETTAGDGTRKRHSGFTISRRYHDRSKNRS